MPDSNNVLLKNEYFILSYARIETRRENINRPQSYLTIKLHQHYFQLRLDSMYWLYQKFKDSETELLWYHDTEICGKANNRLDETSNIHMRNHHNDNNYHQHNK